jgi:DNA-binding Xre family transcriptional regulator
MSKRTHRYRIRLRVEAIEAARVEADMTQEDFADACGFGVSQYRDKLKQTRDGNFPTVTSGTIAGICTVLQWGLEDVLEMKTE